MTSAKFRDFFDPLPPCHKQISADFVPFICFWGTPLPLLVRTSYMEGPYGRANHPKKSADVYNIKLHDCEV